MEYTAHPTRVKSSIIGWQSIETVYMVNCARDVMLIVIVKPWAKYDKSTSTLVLAAH